MSNEPNCWESLWWSAFINLTASHMIFHTATTQYTYEFDHLYSQSIQSFYRFEFAIVSVSEQAFHVSRNTTCHLELAAGQLKHEGENTSN